MYIRKVKGGYRVEVERLGVRDSQTFRTKAEASGWGAQREAEVLSTKRGAYPRKTLQDAIDRYRKDVSPRKGGARAEGLRFDALSRDYPKLVAKILHEIRTPDWVEWRNSRLATVIPASVRRDVNLFRNLFSVAR
jgi:hypothetical protein